MSDPIYFRAPHVSSKFSRLNCRTCGTDELHLRGSCMVCGTHVLALSKDPGGCTIDNDLKAKLKRRWSIKPKAEV